ncbi:hypothetical protein L6164_015679 [Bauhinia variegata]|uniref:Uncharacterized protein n=1 Tax=Bauhinia variegata TaxID=167791 RepID=A0ACB9NMK3_BAUVA|nr:hypothetical protein L6164_015679 [Bauhinia variegata]
MKRDIIISQQLYGSRGEVSKINQKYQNLLEDYLELQKDHVSRKKKLQTAKEKREILLDELRFLRHRHQYLSKLQFAKDGSELAPHKNAYICNAPVRKLINYTVNEPGIDQEGRSKKELVLKTAKVQKKPKNFLKNSNKRKISWQDKFPEEGRGRGNNER